jgi:hypothetical protein
MPIYKYQNPKNGETIEVVQKMNDDHSFTDDSGLEWVRVFFKPLVAIDSNPDPFSRTAFLEKTKGVKTMGDAWDFSQEMSDKRAERSGGTDSMRKKAEKKFYNPKK